MEEAVDTPLRNIDDGSDVEGDSIDMSGESRVGSRGPALCTTSTNTP